MIDEEIIEWHKKTFPDVTYESQVRKLEEELSEVMKAKTLQEQLEEFADVYICSLALWKRFDSFIGMWYSLNYTAKMKDFRHIVANKFDVLKKRTWHEENGVYRHNEK